MTEHTDQIDTVGELRELIETLGIAIGTWADRSDDPAKAQPRERTAAGGAVETIDAMLKGLHRLRRQLVSEVRRSDDAFMAALDEKYGPVNS